MTKQGGVFSMSITIKQKKRRRAIVLGLLSLLICLGAMYLPVHGEEDVYDAVIRLHVLANSDSDEDQALKMQVRDAVLTRATEALEGCADRSEAAERLTRIIPSLTAAAEETLRLEGCNDSVCVTLSTEQYPTRNYQSFCFPAGEYLSLRVMIGEAEGQNFWCVLFPPLCMTAATVSKETAEEEFIAVGLTPNQYGIITETQNTKYKLRFKLLETLQALRR
jgi:stage II sporulation protein R